MNSRIKWLRLLLWAYYFLVIFEGVLRKWLLPGLATPLLVVRDPICIMAVFLGASYLLNNPYVLGFGAIGVLGIIIAMIAGHGNLIVSLYGARILFLHFPLIFLFPLVFERSDLWRFAKATLLIAIPMTVLIGLQYSLPQSHFLNVGIGGEGSSGFSGALGRYRSSGTFAFTNGVSMFYAIAASLLAGWMIAGPRPLPKWLWISAACLILAVPISISRSLAFSYVLIGIFILFAGSLSPRLIGRIAVAALMITILLIPVGRLAIFEDSMEAFSARWESATEAEGGDEGVTGVIETRVIGDMTRPLMRVTNVPFFGDGIGMGTNAGAMLLRGRRTFLLGEGEWYRIIGELGIVLGLLFILIRCWLGGILLLKSLGQLRAGNPIPVVLSAMPLFWLVLGNTAQPTSLGFIILSCGIWVAAFKLESEDSFEYSEVDIEAEPGPSEVLE